MKTALLAIVLTGCAHGSLGDNLYRSQNPCYDEHGLFGPSPECKYKRAIERNRCPENTDSAGKGECVKSRGM
jgi:hypothetical protein